MKRLLWGLIALALLIITLGVSYLFYLQPNYSGTEYLNGLEKETVIKFDDFGIPHIYAQSEHDAYFALGYLQAQERLFQMEMIRRVATGTLSEILGPDLLEVDQLFRTLGINEKAQSLEKIFLASDSNHKNAAQAYFEGINSFVEHGSTPIEFALIGIPKRKFGIADAYRAGGYMAFGFAEGFKVDPIISKIQVLLGSEYLKDLGVHSINDSTYIKNYPSAYLPELSELASIIKKNPIPPLVGSNSWIVSGEQSISGKPIFENDTHIGFSQPAVWYDAHMEYPGFSYYGQYLAGFPFGLLGHNRSSAIGLTMFENDDVDLFVETPNPENQNEVMYKNSWTPLTIRNEKIVVKGQDTVDFVVRESSHGPIINDMLLDSGVSDNPVAASWAFLKVQKDLLSVVYRLNNSANLGQAQAAVADLEAPGLNVMYADTAGDIAWWAAAKLPIRPLHVNSKQLLNGSSGQDDYLGAYDFDKNPQAVNPPWGYVYSANNQPDSVEGVLYPGYYMPMDRARRIIDLLEEGQSWSAERSRQMTGDDTSPVHPIIAKELASILKSEKDLPQNELLQLLTVWDGNHGKEQVTPSVYYTFLTWVTYYAMADELGYKDWQTFAESSIMKRSYYKFISNDASIWWDDMNTTVKESRTDIVTKAYHKSIQVLERNMATKEIKDWQWGTIHTLTHQHPLGMVDIMAPIFNVGPFTVDGGNEVINNLMFNLDTTGVFNVIAGPSMRTVIDLADIEGAVGIIPTGQSGNIMSPHYQDQAELYVNNKYRPQLMNEQEIEKTKKSVLILKPQQD